MFISSCELINKEEKIPGYIYIDSINLITDPITQGSNSQKISDVWINIDGNIQGVYELPAKFPVLETGKHVFQIRAGIKNNGIAASRVKYEFYTMDSVNTTLNEGQILTLNPTVEYIKNADFLFMEDFEDTNFDLVYTSKSDTNIIKSSINAFEGSSSGLIVLDSLHNIFQCKSRDSLYFSNEGKPVYLEMDYKSNIDFDQSSDNIFAVGLFVYTNSNIIEEPVIYLNSTKGKWNKIYIDFTNNVVNHQEALYFRLFIGAQKATFVKNAQIGLDNLKIVTYKK